MSKQLVWNRFLLHYSPGLDLLKLLRTLWKFFLLILLGSLCNIQAMDPTIEIFNRVLSSAINGDKQQLQQLIRSGVSIDVADNRGRSAVLVVTMQNNIKALRLLIELGADVDYYDKSKTQGVIDQTAFLYAGAKGLNEFLLLLINAGARTDIFNYYGGTALIPAAEKGHVSTVKLLLERSKLDINHVNNLGWTALMEAVILSDGGPDQQQIVRLLLAHGADSTITDKEGVSALTHAQHRGMVEIVRLLDN
jgi:ankyrin repeat protein